MKGVLAALLAAVFCLILTACGTSSSWGETVSSAAPRPPQQTTEPEPAEPDPSENTEPVAPAASPAGIPITVTIGEQMFAATLLDNETARQLAERLQLTLDMSELNGNEKYFYMDSDLPTDSYQPGQINVGDLMLYGDSCLVLFYKAFSSSYSYTPLGNVDAPAKLAEALDLLRQYGMHGSMDMMIHFALADTTGHSVAVEYSPEPHRTHGPVSPIARD